MRLKGVRPLVAGTLILSGFLIGGCSLPIPTREDAPSIYTLTAADIAPSPGFSLDRQLVVEEPFAPAAIDTQRIAILLSPTEVQYFGGARWSDRAPRLFQTLLVESFETAEAFAAVGRSTSSLKADYSLDTDLRKFSAALDGAPAQTFVSIEVQATLLSQPDVDALASRVFSARVPAPSNDIRSVVGTFNETLDQIMREIVAWTVTAASGAAVASR